MIGVFLYSYLSYAAQQRNKYTSLGSSDDTTPIGFLDDSAFITSESNNPEHHSYTVLYSPPSGTSFADKSSLLNN